MFERPDHPKDFVGADVSEDGRWLHLSSGSGSMGNRLWIADLGAGPSPDLAANLLACRQGSAACDRSQLTLLEMTEVARADHARDDPPSSRRNSGTKASR